MKKSVKYIIFIFTLLFAISALPVFAARYNVYTPTTYKQVQIVQSPKRTNIEGDAIELLVDYSGSMIKWIDVAKETLIYILPKIPDTSAVALRVFGDRTIGKYSYESTCQATRLVSYFKKQNQANIIKGLQETHAGGGTPLEFALRETVNKDMRNLKIVSSGNLPVAQDKKIILVTDGGEGCGGDPCAYIRNLVKTRQDIVIDVIQLGRDTSLMCLTNATGGRFYKVDGSRQKFEAAFEETFKVPKGTVEQGRKQTVQPVNKQNSNYGYQFINF